MLLLDLMKKKNYEWNEISKSISKSDGRSCYLRGKLLHGKMFKP